MFLDNGAVTEEPLVCQNDENSEYLLQHVCRVGRGHHHPHFLAVRRTEHGQLPATPIVECYASRWTIEIIFSGAKHLTGVGEARNRTRQADERTVPFGLLAQSLVIIWYHFAGQLTPRCG